MPKSQTELAQKALSKLGMPALQAGSEDIALALDAVSPLLARIRNRGVPVPSLSDNPALPEIDDDLFDGLARLLSVSIGPDYGRPDPDDSLFEAALQSYRRDTATAPSYLPAQVQYF